MRFTRRRSRWRRRTLPHLLLQHLKRSQVQRSTACLVAKQQGLQVSLQLLKPVRQRIFIPSMMSLEKNSQHDALLMVSRTTNAILQPV